MTDNNPTKLQSFLRKKFWFKSFTGSYSIGFSLAEGFCKVSLFKAVHIDWVLLFHSNNLKHASKACSMGLDWASYLNLCPKHEAPLTAIEYRHVGSLLKCQKIRDERILNHV